MKKLFQFIGILCLIGISFFYTEKTVSVVKEYDDIMIKLRTIKDNYKKEYINAIIDNDTIIPGISGYEMNINKSYNKMKKFGSFNESLIVTSKIDPKISIKNNMDKYIISGNNKKKNVSMVFIINKDMIDDLIIILSDKNIRGNLVFNNDWIIKNTNLIPPLIYEKHNIGVNDYTDFSYSKNIIKKIGKQKNVYCFTDKKDSMINTVCDNEYKILIGNIISKNPYENTKLQLKNGKILVYEYNDQLIDELKVIINYINNKGYNIINLNELLKE